jgi:Mor family transcriptional regulator
MSKVRKINAREFIRDVRSGVQYDELLRKYHLREIQLNRAIQRLLDTKHLTKREAERLISRRRSKLNDREFVVDVLALLDKYNMPLSQFSSQIERLRDAGAFHESHEGAVTAEGGGLKRRIDAREFAEDVQLGMDYVNLAAKYNITKAQVHQLIDRLAGTKLLGSDVVDRTVPFDMRISFPEASAWTAPKKQP